MELHKITRFEVIDHTKMAIKNDAFGRILTKYGISLELSVQDEGRTLKVFLSDKK